jgi:hypothetical protein
MRRIEIMIVDTGIETGMSYTPNAAHSDIYVLLGSNGKIIR